MPVKYPRDCEIWEDLDTGTTFLVPEDCKKAILKAKAVRNIKHQIDFTADNRIHMMEVFYFLTGRGDYVPPKAAKISERTFDKTGDNSTTDKSASTTVTKPIKTYKPEPKALEVIRSTLNAFGPDKYRRKRASAF